MMKDLEAYRRSRSTETRLMTVGANALDLLPNVGSRSHLRVVESPSELPKLTTNITDLKDFLKRKSGAIVELPSTSEVAVRQQIIENPQPKEQGKFIEREIDPDKPWSAFGQVMFIKEHIIDGKVIKKIAAISIAYPGGVGTRMAKEALSKTSGIEQSAFETWDGEKEGAIIAAGKEVPNAIDQFKMMNAFVENSGSVITDRHAQADHEVVQHFFKLQEPRRGFLEKVKEYAAKILKNPKFTGWSAVAKEFEKMGIYLVEGIIENNEWFGGDPKGEKMLLSKMASDKPHLKWLKWAEKTASAMRGDGIIVDAEDTETVQSCGGADNKCGEKRGCAAFFEKMEGELFDHNGINVKDYMIASGMAGSIATSKHTESHVPGGGGGGGAILSSRDGENCSSCGESRNSEDGCKCSKS